jgi:hypothetical protein
MVQMIFNEHIDRLIEVAQVQEFMRRHDMRSKLCKKEDNYSLLLYRLPYVIEFHDALIENYLEITFADLDEGLMIGGGSALSCSLDLGLQNLSELQQRKFDNHPQNHLFLSSNALKMDDLNSNLEAIDKLLPMIESKGLSSMRDGTFDIRFDFTQSVSPMDCGLKEKYLQCLKEGC